MNPALVFALLLAACQQRGDDIEVRDAWVRATVPGQDVAAAYLTIASPTDTRLIAATSAAARITELHSMSMEGGMMRMQHLADGLPVRGGAPQRLQPGGNHLMLIGLAKPLAPGDKVSIRLDFAAGGGAAKQIDVVAEVRDTR